MSYCIDKITDKQWSFKSYTKMANDKFIINSTLLAKEDDELNFCRELSYFYDKHGSRPTSILLMACGCVLNENLESYECLRMALQLIYANTPNDDRITKIFNDHNWLTYLSYGKCYPRYKVSWIQAETNQWRKKYNVDIDELNREEKINFSVFMIRCLAMFLERNRYNTGDEIAVVKSLEYIEKIIKIAKEYIQEDGLDEKVG